MSSAEAARPRWVPPVIVTVGVLIASVMVGLGLWQAQAFVDSGAESAAAATAAPPVALDAARQGGAVGELWGRTVVVNGSYLPAQEVRVVGADGSERVLTAFQLEDGRAVAVVRGMSPATTPPAGTVEQRGVLLPTEAQATHTTPPGTYGSVRLQSLAQAWPQPLVAGYVTLSTEDAERQGMTAAPVVLPEHPGRTRNRGYALQWWVFAAFALGMSIVVARSYHRRGFALTDDA